jgi:hypothetical protein
LPGWLRAGAVALGIVLAVALASAAALTVANRETVSAAEALGLITAAFEARRLEFSRGLPSDARSSWWS